MFYSVIRAKMTKQSGFDYFSTFCRQHAIDVIMTLFESGWYLIEERKIINYDPDMEAEITLSHIGNPDEQLRLKKYYRQQKPSE